jgi:hypothetical protein
LKLNTSWKWEIKIGKKINKNKTPIGPKSLKPAHLPFITERPIFLGALALPDVWTHR